MSIDYPFHEVALDYIFRDVKGTTKAWHKSGKSSFNIRITQEVSDAIDSCRNCLHGRPPVIEARSCAQAICIPFLKRTIFTLGIIMEAYKVKQISQLPALKTQLLENLHVKRSIYKDLPVVWVCKYFSGKPFAAFHVNRVTQNKINTTVSANKSSVSRSKKHTMGTK